MKAVQARVMCQFTIENLEQFLDFVEIEPRMSVIATKSNKFPSTRSNLSLYRKSSKLVQRSCPESVTCR